MEAIWEPESVSKIWEPKYGWKPDQRGKICQNLEAKSASHNMEPHLVATIWKPGLEYGEQNQGARVWEPNLEARSGSQDLEAKSRSSSFACAWGFANHDATIY